MKSSKCLVLVVALAAVAVMLLPAGAKANNLTYNVTVVDFVNQTVNNQCVIGDSSCDTGQILLQYTSNSGPCNPTGICDFFSPVYVAGAVGFSTDLTIPLSFDIGVDENFAAGQSQEVLDSFKLFLCSGTTLATCTTTLDSTTSANTLVDVNNGNGHTDGKITGFSTLVAGNHYAFEATWHSDTDGQEQFWLIPKSSTTVPEPTTLTMLGAGLLGLVGLARRKLLA